MKGTLQRGSPPGLTVTVDAECVAVEGPRITFAVKAHDGMDAIGEGRHQRFVVASDKFNVPLDDKRARIAVANR